MTHTHHQPPPISFAHAPLRSLPPQQAPVPQAALRSAIRHPRCASALLRSCAPALLPPITAACRTKQQRCRNGRVPATNGNEQQNGNERQRTATNSTTYTPFAHAGLFLKSYLSYFRELNVSFEPKTASGKPASSLTFPTPVSHTALRCPPCLQQSMLGVHRTQPQSSTHCARSRRAPQCTVAWWRVSTLQYGGGY